MNPGGALMQGSSNAALLLQQGKELYSTGQFSQAVTVWQQASETFTAEKDALSQAMVLSNLSMAYQQLGEWPRATEASAQSLKLLQIKRGVRSSEDRLRILAQALNTQGSLQLAMGQSEQALTTWEKATATYRKAGVLSGIIGSRLNQAQALQSLGIYNQARDILLQVRQELTSQPDSLLKAEALLSLGNTLRVAGDLSQSRIVLQSSLAIAQKLQSASDISAALISLGSTANFALDYRLATELFQQAFDASTAPLTRVQAQLNQLSVLLKTHFLSDAQTLWPQIQSQITNLSASRQAIYARINFAQSLLRLKQTGTEHTPSWLEVGQLLSTAVQQAQSIDDKRASADALGFLGSISEQTHHWSNAQHLTEQAIILAQSINAPDIGYRWQWQLGRLLKAQGNIPEAITAYGSSVEDLKALRNDLVGVNPDIQFDFREQVEPVYRQLVDLLVQSAHPSQSNLKQARVTLESLQIAELNNFFRVACLQGKPVQIDSVVNKSDPTAAVIYPIILPDKLAVILKLSGQQLLFYQTVVAQDKVEKTLAELRLGLKAPEELKRTQALLHQVYEWLLKPVETDLAKSQVKTLVFVLDGSLRNIPMPALYDGQKYLVEKYATALTPGLQLLPPTSLNRQRIRALTAGITEAQSGFRALPNVAVELAQIKYEVRGAELLNQQFTSNNLLKQINSHFYPIVHLATHGQFSSQADKTFVLAWGERISVNELSDLLQSRDPSSHNAIELLVLSACETATGDKRAALGLAGVAVRAGARSTLATLWPVQDKSTAILMTKFYSGLVNDHLNKAEALRQAQLSLLKNLDFTRPVTWSPYVLVGNWL